MLELEKLNVTFEEVDFSLLEEVEGEGFWEWYTSPGTQYHINGFNKLSVAMGA